MISGISIAHAASPPAAGRTPAEDPQVMTLDESRPIPSYAPVLMRYEQQARVLVTEFRNPETGELRVQYPAPAVVQRYSESRALTPDEPAPEDKAAEAEAEKGTGTGIGSGDGKDAAPEVKTAAPAEPAPQPSTPQASTEAVTATATTATGMGKKAVSVNA